jgi:exonuclease III
MHSIPVDIDSHNAPLFLSINIQSLNSKYEELRNQIVELSSKNIFVDVIAIQETWEICLPDALALPGFQPILYKTRTHMRGGGVGFYVRNGLNAKILENLSPFEQKIFEALTIQVTYPEKSVLLTSAYRSNGRLGNLTPAQQFERFQVAFDELLYNLNRSRLQSYIFFDSNIDLLNIQSEDSATYLNSFLSHGFLQIVMKATCMQNQSRTLIDHILTSCKDTRFHSGTIISDISDHFFTFVRPICSTPKSSEKTTFVRSFNLVNLTNFNNALSGTDWSPVTNSNDVDEAYEIFWSSFIQLYELFFSQKKSKIQS